MILVSSYSGIFERKIEVIEGKVRLASQCEHSVLADMRRQSPITTPRCSRIMMDAQSMEENDRPRGPGRGRILAEPRPFPPEPGTGLVPMRGACRAAAAYVKSHFGRTAKLSPTCYKRPWSNWFLDDRDKEGRKDAKW